MRVPVFSVGMGRRLFGFNKKTGLTVGELSPESEAALEDNTDYRLSLLPIGGYARIEGMIDETQDEALPAEIQPWEFRAKSWWKRSIVICAGVIMNTLLALAIFSGHHYSSGEDVRLTTTVGYVSLGSLSERQGVKAQDRVLAVDGVPVANWEEVERETLMKHVGRDQAITFERNGQRFTLNYATAKITGPDELVKAIGLDPVGYLPPVITDVAKGPDGPSPAMKAGLQAGDKIIRIQGDSIVSGLALIDHVGANAGKAVTMEWVRGDSLKSATVTPDANGKIGVALQGDDYRGPKRHESYSLGRAIALGWSDVTTNASLTLKMLGMVLTGKTPVTKALAGPVKIAQMASRSAKSGSGSFIMFMGLLSMSLALINILPIPALDGGHLIIILIEAALGRELSQGFKLGFQKIGVLVLLALMVFMVFNDIRSL